MTYILKFVGICMAAFILILALKLPVESLLLTFGFGEFESHHLAGIPSRITIIILSLFAIKKLNLLEINGLDNLKRIKNIQAVIIPISIFSFVLFGNLSNFHQASSGRVLLFLISALFVGFAEEFAFRGLILPAIMKKTQKIFVPIFISSLLFGIVHYINLIKTPGNIDGINSQVVFAMSIGIFLSGLFLRTGNILIVGILHFFFNISFSNGELRNEIVNDQILHSDKSNLASILFTLFIFGLIGLSGLIMTRMEGKKNIFKKFESGRNSLIDASHTVK